MLNKDGQSIDQSAELDAARRRIADLERQLAETRASAESEIGRLKTLFERTPLGYQSLDAEGNFLEVNQTWLDILGYSREEVIGRNFGDFLTEEWRDHFKENFPRFKAIGEVIGVEFEMVRKDGSTIMAAFNGRIGHDEEGGFKATHCLFQDITTRRRAEDIMQARLRLMEFAADHSLDQLLVAILDEAEELTDSRIAFFHLLQADQKTLTMQAWSSRTAQGCQTTGKGLHYPVDKAGVWVDCIRERRAVIHNDYASLPHRRGLPEGHSPLIRELVVPIFRGGVIVGILGVGNKACDYDAADVEMTIRLADLAWDIAERKRTEEALRASEEQLRMLAASIPGALYQFRLNTDGSMEFPYMSEGVREVFGIGPEEAMGDATVLVNHVHPEDVDRVMEGIAESAESMLPYALVHRVRHPDGEVRWLRAGSIPIRQKNGATLWHGVAIDITDQERAQDALTAQMATDARLADVARELLSHGSMEDISMHVLEAAKELTTSEFGYVGSIDEATGNLVSHTMTRDIWEACQVPDKDIVFDKYCGMWGWVLENLQPVMTNNISADPRSTGTPEGHLPIRAFLSAPALIEGELVGQIALANPSRPYTERDQRLVERLADLFALAVMRRNYERELMATSEAAEAASKAKSQFLANMSHELRTPLNGIQGMLQLLMAARLDDKQMEYAQTAIQSSRRLARLLSDILDLSRVEAGKMSLHMQPFDPNEILTHLCDLFRPTAVQAEVDFECRIDPDIPESLLGDAVRVQQVLGNLVDNAFKFTSQGRVVLEASLLPRGGPKRIRVLFTVSDTGIGIPEAKLGTLFEAFTQGSQGHTRAYQGAGLGLSICKRLVHLMGGDISIETEAGAGTCVHFSVPFGLAGAGERTTEQPAGESHVDGLRVLFAEDDRINRFTGVRLLESLGCVVTAVNDGREAVEALADDTYDVLLMDVQMPVLDGVGATRAIRDGKAGPGTSDIPIIALTAFAMEGDREHLLEAGMDDYLSKPVERGTLLQVLRRFAPSA